MTRSQALAALRRAVVPAVLAADAAMVLVLPLIGSRVTDRTDLPVRSTVPRAGPP